MYISSVKIQGFRNFKDIDVPLHEGINVIIGANNSGKSNLLKAIGIALNSESFRRIGLDDIFHETDVEVLKVQSPRIFISLTCSQSENEPNDSEVAALLSESMESLEPHYQATINYSYSLSADKEGDYVRDMESLDSAQDIWELIQSDYARFYEFERWGGLSQKTKLNDVFKKIDYHFLDAIRDVGRDMCMGYNPLLRDVLNFFVDYDIKSDSTKTEEQKKEAIKNRQTEFKDVSSPLMSNIADRLLSGKNVLLDYATSIGASFNSLGPDFNGQLSETEIFSVLRLMINHELNVEIPATHNGLGYNNLIFMSLLLAKMQASADTEYMGRQATLYSLLAIEEPEAHLHPSMQYQFLNFLKRNRETHSVGQVIVTTHSPQMVSAVGIDNLICLNRTKYGKHHIGYPRKIFSESTDDKISKAFVQRYLDATRSDMFFADKLIFVEGMAEEILIPTFARYLEYDLTERHVLVVNMGLRYYSHFLKLFDTSNEFCIFKKVACVTDVDPCCDTKSCYPYEYGLDEGSTYTRHADPEMTDYAHHKAIRFFRQDSIYGKTLEYDIARFNPTCTLLITDSIQNADEISRLMAVQNSTEMLSELRDSKENTRISDSIRKCTWDDFEKCKAIIASRYLNSIGKGGNALELSLKLEENLSLPNDDPKKVEFVVPTYIQDALSWLLS